jgi:hypothetical protein
VAKDFAHLAGTYRQDDWLLIDERAQRFKPLLNDEYGRDGLAEMVGLLGFPHQKANEYTMARYSGLNQNMLTGIPYSVLVDDDFAPTCGDRLTGSTSLPAKNGLWTTSAGRLEIDDYNVRAAGFTPAVLEGRNRYLDEEWVKWNHTSPDADALYRLAQRGSRNLEGRGAGLLRSDLPGADLPRTDLPRPGAG